MGHFFFDFARVETFARAQLLELIKKKLTSLVFSVSPSWAITAEIGQSRFRSWMRLESEVAVAAGQDLMEATSVRQKTEMERTVKN